MNKLLAPIEKSLPLIKNIFIPALIFGFGIIYFCLQESISLNSMLTLHTTFYTLSFVIFLVLLYFNQRKPVFFILISTLSYVLINYLKLKQGMEYLSLGEYKNLSLLVPINLIVFYFLPSKKLLHKENVYILITIFAQFAFCEHLGNNSFISSEASLNIFSIVLFGVGIIAMFIKSSLSGNILDYALFFATLCISCGFYYSENPTALTIFFCSSALIAFIAVAQNLYYETYKDELTGFSSRDAYVSHSKDFPLKYSIGIIRIDDYENFSNMFGRSGQKALIKMIAIKIEENTIDEQIYRYSNDEFIILFKNEDKNSAFEKLEKIRRAVASASFKLKNCKKLIKITVSCCVSEKKRSDANSVEVLGRARKALLKTLSFSHNVTSKA